MQNFTTVSIYDDMNGKLECVVTKYISDQIYDSSHQTGKEIHPSPEIRETIYNIHIYV